MLDEDDKVDLQDEALAATTTVLVSLLQGEPPSVQGLVELGMGIAITAIGMANPLLGAVAGMAWSLIGGILFPEDPEDSPMNRMYRKIMKEVGIALEQKQMETEIGDASTDLQAVMEELQWMPAMLGGLKAEGPTPDQKRILLTYNIMIQHDIAKISARIQSSAGLMFFAPVFVFLSNDRHVIPVYHVCFKMLRGLD